MNDFGTVNRFAVRWVDFMGGRSYEIAIVFLIAACLWLLISRRASAFLGYGLFMLVLIKAVLPFDIPSPALLNELPISSHSFTAPMRDWGMRPVFPPMRHEPAYAGETMETARIENAGEMPPAAPVTNERETVGQHKEDQISFSALFMLVWTTVVCFLLIRFIRSQWVIHRFILRAKEGPSVDFPFDFDALKKQIGLRRNIQVASSDSISIPFVWGVFRPHLIVPREFFSDFSEKQTRWIVLHELAHIKRHDALISFLQKLTQTLYFFHPAVWIANGTINRHKEYICDDIAMAASQTPRMDCGQSILSLTKLVNTRLAIEAGLLGGCRSSAFIRRRIMRILDEERVLRVRQSLGIVLVLTLVACITLPSVRAGSGLTVPASVDATGQEDRTPSPDEASTEQTASAEGDALPGRIATRSQMALRLVLEGGGFSYRRLSPDGLRMVYAAQETTGYRNLKFPEIIVRDLSTGVERKYGEATSFFPPVWSPDGKRVAFLDGTDIVLSPGSGSASSNPWSGHAINILTLDSGEVEKTNILGLPCDWSGEGRFLLVLDLKDSTIDDETSSRVQVVDLKTGELQTVISPFNWDWWVLPRLSPDGNFVLYNVPGEEEEDRYQVYIQPIDSDEPIRITAHEDGGWNPLWSGDGTQILFMGKGESEQPSLYTVAFQNGKPMGEPEAVVSDMGKNLTLYSCSNAGALLFSESGGPQGDIFSTNIDPVSGGVLGEPEQLTSGTSQPSWPVWSRDGKYIAYYEGANPRDLSLRVMNADGSDKRTLGSVESLSYEGGKAWHPDNEHILYPGRETDPENPDKTLDGVYSVSMRTRERKLIYHDPEFQGGMHISPDGKHLALTSGSEQKPQLYIVDTNGQNRRQLVKSDGAIKKPVFTPDGKEIVYTFVMSAEGKEDRRSIMAVPIEGGEPRKIYASEDPNEGYDTRPASWLPDGRFVFDIIRHTHGDRPQYAVNMDGKSDPVKISDYLGGSYALSPDGTKAVYGLRGMSPPKLWLMSDFLPND